MAWLPRLSWQPVQASDIEAFDLDASHDWEVFCVEWFGYGVAIYARAVA